LNVKILPELKKAGSFDGATKIMEFIEDCANYLDVGDIEKILSASLKNRGMYNQVIDARYGHNFFNFLLGKTYDLKGGLERWKEFYNQLSNKQKLQYSTIKESLEKQGIYFNDEEQIRNDIPF